MQEIYNYKWRSVSHVYVLSGIGLIFFCALFFMVAHSKAASTLPFPAWFALSLMPLACAGVAFSAYLMWRPIGIDDEGITSFLPGGRRKLLRWSSIKKIDRVKFYDNSAMRNRFQFMIYADGGRIRFDDYIDHIDTLTSSLNDYIEKYQIDSFDIDRVRATRKTPASTLADVARNKDLNGVRTPTTKF